MLSIRGALACMDELKQNGFKDNQARVLAMAIDDTVEDRLSGFLTHIDKRFDDVDKRFKERFDWFVYKAAFLTTGIIAASIAIALGAYQFVLTLIS